VAPPPPPPPGAPGGGHDRLDAEEHADDVHLEDALDLIEQRHGVKSTVIASQIPVSEWHGLIGEGTIADAILDRVVYSSHRIDLKGESLRKKQRLT
jgi:DNA replication protein DnaC